MKLRLGLGLAILLLWAGPAQAFVSFGPAGGLWYPANEPNQSMASILADFNGDGALDFASAGDGTGIYVWLNNGRGGFAAAPGSPIAVTDGSHPALAAGDLNGDGNTDLVVDQYNGMEALFGTGSGSFADPDKPPRTIALPGGDSAGGIVLADTSGDGKLDIVATGYAAKLYVFRNENNGQTYTAIANSPVTLGEQSLGRPVVADFNEDGRLDIAVSQYTAGTVRLYTNGGPLGFLGSTSTAVTRAFALAGGDLDNDGHADLVVSGGSSLTNVYPLIGNGHGVFAVHNPDVTPYGVGALAVGDVDGDGVADALAGEPTDIEVLLGDGAGYLNGGPAPIHNQYYGPKTLAIGDVNGDARPDVLMGASSSSASRIFLNRGQPGDEIRGGSPDFGTQPTGTVSGAQGLGVFSNGDAALNVAHVGITGPNADDFLISRDECSGRRVVVFTQCGVTIRFAPQSAGAKTATLRVDDDAPGDPNVITLSGTGGDLPSGPAGAAGAPGTAGLTGAPGVKGERGPRGLKQDVDCDVDKTKKAKKVKVTCTVKTAKSAVARLTRHGRLVARRHLGAGRHRLVFRMVRGGHYRLHVRGQ